MLASMRIACRKRPIDPMQIELAANRIEDQLGRDFEVEVSTREIGHCVMKELSAIDTVAYVRFASVYQEFETVADFASIIDRVQREEALNPFKQLQQNHL
jgi:transcriptional repressor NrdR